MLPEWLPWLLQVNDSQFPSGAYAHSLGLEDLVQSGLVRDADGLQAFLRQQVVPALCAFDLPVFARAHAAAVAGRTDELAALDRELDAWKLAAELRQASQRMGSRRLALVRHLAPAAVLDTFAALETPQHQLVVCALELRALPVAAAACALAHQSITSSVTAAVKLLRLGQERAQTIIHTTLAELAPAIDSAVTQPPDQSPRWFNPLLEIASLRHARARERLFIS